MKTTEELVHEIKNSKDIMEYMKRNKSEMQINTFPEYLNEWLTKKNLTRADVVKKSNLNKAYVYQIFSGKKYPSRDKVISLAFGLGLDADETQSFLKQAGYRELYPRDSRDSLLFFSINQGKTIIDTNEMLYDHNLDVLE